ncbi:MAG: aldehyde dehydrogenase family protein, partial [Firmicutes bacterium]|nr:aldehyde dehydrogenase family protein [Bacillota bacterium]
MINKVKETVKMQREYISSRKSYDINFRIEKLKELYGAILAHEEEICLALKKDLGKSYTESYMCEVGLTLSELSYQIKHVKKWSRPKTKLTPLASFHAKSYTVAEPRGNVLILSPWNYPFMLCMEPMIGAVAAGNCCIIQPSADAPATSSVVKLIVDEVFERGHVDVLEGGVNVATALLEERFDYIFYTGSVNVGKLVMEKASRNLTPVTLELGGKSPCI